MIKQSDIIADMHTHTIASLHAFSTVAENLACAKKTGMKYMAITDHFFHNGDDLNKQHEIIRIKVAEGRINPHSEVKVIRSAEFNILQDTGYRKKLSALKWRPIGLHKSFVPQLGDMDYEELYEGFEEASEWCTTFNHIERELDSLCYGKFTDGIPKEAKRFLERVVCLAKKKDIILEINESSLANRERYVPVIRTWMDMAVQNGNRFCLGTDAHYCEEVGLFDKSIELLNEYGIGKERVLNCNEEEVVKLLKS